MAQLLVVTSGKIGVGGDNHGALGAALARERRRSLLSISMWD
jgi:septum formation inhibitor-activating ATPase MinD